MVMAASGDMPIKSSRGDALDLAFLFHQLRFFHGLAIGNYVRQDGAWNDFVWQWFGIYESMMCVFISFGLLWLFRDKVNMSNKTLSWLSAQSYGAYIVHLPLMIGVQNVFDGVWMGAFGKFVFVGVVTTVLSFALTWLLRLLPGVKRVL